MKLYKLIREYPGSPTLGTVVKEIIGENLYYYINSWTDGRIFRVQVKSYPEFWEEIKEEAEEMYKDYQWIEQNKPMFSKQDIKNVFAQLWLHPTCEDVLKYLDFNKK